MDHVLCCKQNNGEIEARHDAIVREFKNLTNHAGLQFIDARLGESSTVNQVDDRAADGCIRGLCHKPLHIDVTVANPTGQTCLNISQNEDNSSSIRQHANREKERIKNDKHLHRCQEINAKFMPLAFEIHGSASDSVNKLHGSPVFIAFDRIGRQEAKVMVSKCLLFGILCHTLFINNFTQSF